MPIDCWLGTWIGWDLNILAHLAQKPVGGMHHGQLIPDDLCPDIGQE